MSGSGARRELLERDADLARLRHALDDARAGAGRLVLVSGEAGIGKTTLIQAFLSEVRRDGSFRVLSGGCDNLVTPRTLGPFHDLARAARPDLRDALRGGTADAVLDALLAELDAPTTLLVVEDVHWADEATIDALAFLSRRVERYPALILVTYRDDETVPGSPLLRLLGAVRSPVGVRLPLAPLSARAVSSLAADHGVGLRLYASTGGNPFFVTELLAAQDEGLPASVRDAVLARISTLGDPTQALLEVLAVVPTRVETRLLDVVHPEWARDAAPAERRGILEVRDSGLAFRHDLSRLAVANGLPGARRLALGQAVLAALLQQDPLDEARILHHAVTCGDAEVIVAHGPAAARRAARAGAHQQALSHYEQLEPHAELLPPAERAAVSEEHAWELYNALRFADAVRYSRAAVARRRDLGDPVALGRALVALAWHLYLDAEVARAGTVVDEAVAVLEPTGDAGALGLARSYRAFLQVLSDREEDGLAELGLLSSTGPAADADPLAAARLSYRGLGQAFLGDPAGLELLRRGVADAAAQGQREFAALGYTALVKASRRLGRDADVRRYAEQGLTRTRESDLHSHGFTLEAHLYQLLFQAGRWDEAEEGLRRLLRAAPEAGILGRETLPHLGRLLMRRGHREADALLERAWALACRTDILPVLVPAGMALLERAWLAGDPAPERSRVELLLARTDRPGAQRYRGELLRYARRCGWPVKEFAGCRPEHLLGLRGDWAGAAAEWARIGDPYERALELAESGLAEPTLEALGLLDDLEAEPAARLVRGRLRDIGVARIPRGPRPATRAHPAGLTERQVDVLGMLGEGLTNAEIAARLVVSVRTVDHHVSAVLTKLGVPTRRDAARLAGQLS
jgi:DNA-binding CsgD family transcriptional regulator/tetratricopeptide (TPR) repeat protein